MRVLLVDPPVSFLTGSTRHLYPLGLGYLAGSLVAEGHEVRTLLPDTRAYDGDDPWGEIRRTVADEAPELVGITSITANFGGMVRLVAEVRAALGPDVPVVIGGPDASSRTRTVARVPGVSCVVRGEGEDAMVRLARGWQQDRSFDPTTVPGVHAQHDGQVVSGPPRPTRSDIDALPWPHREGFVWDELLHPALYESVITQRGCPYSCIYCAIPKAPDARTRYRSPAGIGEEIAHLVDRYRIPYLSFYDSVFTMHRRRTFELLRQLGERGITVPFGCQTRANRVDPELLDAMAAQHCDCVYFGIESGDEDSLVRIKKKMSLQTIRDAVRMTKERGMRANGFFIVGFPWEDERLIRKTVDFALELGLDMVSLFSATPLPDTELWEMTRDSRPQGHDEFQDARGNLTTLPDDLYTELFHELKDRCDTYNRAQTWQRMKAVWPGALPDVAMPPR